MATYGTKEGNYFRADPNNKSGKKLQNVQFSVTIDDENSTTPGKITIYSSVPNTPSSIKEIGTIPRGESFALTAGVTTTDELEYFSQPDVITSVKNHAKITTEKSLYDLGVTDYQQRSSQANNLVEGPEKTANPTEAAAGPTANPDVTSAVQNAKPIDVALEASLGRDDFGMYTYPIDLKSNKQDRIIFTLKEIKGSTIQPKFAGPITRKKENINGQVTLPIQSGITDSNSVDWSGSSLNAIDAYVASASLTLMNTTGAPALISSMQQILGDIATQVKAQSDPLKLFLAQEAAGIQGLVSRATGGVLNPNLELLFNGPQLRPFNFTFRLSPREEKEATEVRSIIRFFKEAMSVRTTESNVFLKSPFVFDIKYVTYDNDGNVLPNGGHHPSISRINTCALLSCDVDYTPDGSYMTFTDGSRTMTSYQMSLRFSELEPIYSTDYTDNNIPTDNIGF
jgi:hypothetical protein